MGRGVAGKISNYMGRRCLHIIVEIIEQQLATLAETLAYSTCWLSNELERNHNWVFLLPCRFDSLAVFSNQPTPKFELVI